MAVRVEWIGKAPPDAEEWEDLLRAEYGTAMGTIELWLEKVGDAWQVTRARESPTPAGPTPRAAEVRQRFVAALRMGGKPVVDEGDDAELATVTTDELNARTEDARRRGGSGE